MNKRVAKPKRKLPIIPDDNITEAQTEKYLRDNRADINRKLQEARDDIARGEIAPLESLPELLKAARKFHRTRS